jgi:hypothetical protein
LELYQINYWMEYLESNPFVCWPKTSWKYNEQMLWIIFNASASFQNSLLAQKRSCTHRKFCYWWNTILEATQCLPKWHFGTGSCRWRKYLAYNDVWRHLEQARKKTFFFRLIVMHFLFSQKSIIFVLIELIEYSKYLEVSLFSAWPTNSCIRLLTEVYSFS